MNIKSKLSLRSISQRNMLVVTLMSMLLFISLFSSCALVAMGADAPVMSETELVSAINGAPSNVPTVITLGKDIILTTSLSIPAGKNITLASDGSNEFKLLGADGQSTIIVASGGILVLNGIVVTHVTNGAGSGVNVTSGGALILLSGRIFNNTDVEGGGVVNYGNFTMSGGAVLNNTKVMGGVVNYGNFTMSGSSSVIANNTVIDVEGDVYGGVLNLGIFRMSGGEIASNTDCGVSNAGNFTMSGGKILKNIVSGVYINHDGNFTMSGGEISNHKADNGGGVHISSSFGVGNFTMTGGMIFNNSATECGGGVYNSGSFFSLSGDAVIANNTANVGGGLYTNGNVSMSGGVISNNTAASGGGVYNYYGNFSMTKGELFNNTAASDGGGIYSFGGNFTVSCGKISYNTANKNGGGIAAPGIDGLAYVYVLEGVTFSNNRASAAYARSPAHDYLYESRVSSRVTWTSPFTQGYNNYDISYVSGPQLDKDGNPIPSPSPSPTRSPTGSPRPTGTNTPPVNPPKNGEFDWRIVAVVLAIVVILLIVVLIFYLLPKRSRPKQVKEEDLNNFTIV